jgi:citrate synthase
MILHAEHEMNASTFTARVVAGTNADMHSAVVAAMCALKGPIHGGANAAAMEMMEEFGSPAGVAEGVAARLEARKPLYGFGHPLYRAMDPRAPILKRLAQRFADDSEPNFVDIAAAAEREAQAQKRLWPNVDLYSGVLYRYLGIPTDLFIPLFEMSRVAGQAAHVLEQHAGGNIIRPSTQYVGEPRREFPVRQRS